MPDTDPINEIQSVIQHAREEDQTNTQQTLDRISEGLGRLEEREDPPRSDRIASIIDQIDRLEDNVDDPEEATRLREARDRLRDLMTDPERVETPDEEEGSSDE